MDPYSWKKSSQFPPVPDDGVVTVQPKKKFSVSSLVMVALIAGLLYYSYGFFQASRGKRAAVTFICTTNAVQDSLKFLSGAFSRGFSQQGVRSDGLFVVESIKADSGLRKSASYFRKVAGKPKQAQEKIAEDIAKAAARQCPQKTDAIAATMVVGLILGTFEQ